MSNKKHLQSQSKEIIAKVYHRMKYEAVNGVEKLTDARWRTSQAVGVSESSITRILKEEKQASTSNDTSQIIFKSPSKRNRVRTKSRLDDFDMGVLRKTIATFQTEFNELPTLRKLRQVLTERIGFNGCIETLRTILKESGYEWTKKDNHRKVQISRSSKPATCHATGNLTSHNEQENDAHSNIQCDECGLDVVGFRYKCVQCADCDLCAACEARGAHPDHYVLRIPRPLQLAQSQVLVDRIHDCLEAEGLLQPLDSDDEHTIKESTIKEEFTASEVSVQTKPVSEVTLEPLAYVKVEPSAQVKAEPLEEDGKEEALKPAPLALQPTTLTPVSDSRQHRKRRPEAPSGEAGLIKMQRIVPVNADSTVGVKVEPQDETVPAEGLLAPYLKFQQPIPSPHFDSQEHKTDEFITLNNDVI